MIVEFSNNTVEVTFIAKTLYYVQSWIAKAIVRLSLRGHNSKTFQ